MSKNNSVRNPKVYSGSIKRKKPSQFRVASLFYWGGLTALGPVLYLYVHVPAGWERTSFLILAAIAVAAIAGGCWIGSE